MRKKLPIGIDSFEKIRTNDFYYVDKTLFIKELLENWGEVNLFTRPRRFGKTLNMSMLKSFFDIGSDLTLFEGLQIAQETELCEKYQGNFPVISISLKSVDGLQYDSAVAALRRIIGNEASRFDFLGESKKLNQNEKELYRGLTAVTDGTYLMADDTALFEELLKKSVKSILGRYLCGRNNPKITHRFLCECYKINNYNLGM